MQVEIRRVDSYNDERAVISAVTVTDEIQSAIDILEKNCRSIMVIGSEGNVLCRTDRIYYAESVDKIPGSFFCLRYIWRKGLRRILYRPGTNLHEPL